MPSIPRLRRRAYWLATIAAWLVFVAVREGLGLERMALATTAWAALHLTALSLLTIARLHDRSRSGWTLAVVLIPIAGAVWLAWEVACRRGVRGTNRFGPDPRMR
jgi:uncharacterized membrane protein YhaH (DUF805 family)